MNLLLEIQEVQISMEKLVEMGDMSSLGEDIASTSFYHRDRGEDLKVTECHSVGYIWNLGSEVEFTYLYIDGRWVYRNNRD